MLSSSEAMLSSAKLAQNESSSGGSGSSLPSSPDGANVCPPGTFSEASEHESSPGWQGIWRSASIAGAPQNDSSDIRGLWLSVTIASAPQHESSRASASLAPASMLDSS
eukprot:CAMPEP_0113294498 /NCGR_PEP_ID=MMETSP0008_2-20120614/35935_1 /TAXON_ID=97485 /ORGANISM="Prymnesium parvum" /LENGTH=108 /DNA_ID=CAMNT_0000147123 /DNA_START=152 /DNA_END=478 /DNA_ORIENTATION=+ /assembly_acc=CAM_ASM_000153